MDVTDPWDDVPLVFDTDSRPYKTDKELQPRRSAQVGLSARTTDDFPYYVARLTRAWDCPISPAVDRALRVYAAHLMDTEAVADHRGPLEIGISVPPRGWVAKHREVGASSEEEATTETDSEGICEDERIFSDGGPVAELRENEQWSDDTQTVQTTPVVRELLERIRDEKGVEDMSTLAYEAVKFVCGE